MVYSNSEADDIHSKISINKFFKFFSTKHNETLNQKSQHRKVRKYSFSEKKRYFMKC